MESKFREYHQFTNEEYKALWRECIFVFDTNTLLNMYRYSRKTVNAYIKVLNELKKNGQIWIPYQVGFEFYENRMDVIREYEKSYDDLLSVLEKAKKDIEVKYKNHPFLDLEGIKTEVGNGLIKTEERIKQAQAKHPKWLENDDVLDNINAVFDGCVGDPYDLERLDQVYSEGRKRYEKKIPPGFKDDKKPEEKKYGDLVLWFQILDYASEIKKPIIFVTGDVKSDWWLEKDGSRIMPLPMLKKEMLDKAGVDFHIYTADRFLDLYESGEKGNEVHRDAVNEVRKVRELDEMRRLSRIESFDPQTLDDSNPLGRYYISQIYVYELLQRASEVIRKHDVEVQLSDHFEYLYRRVRTLRNKAAHGYYDEHAPFMLADYVEDLIHLLRNISESEAMTKDGNGELLGISEKLKEYIQILKNFPKTF